MSLVDLLLFIATAGLVLYYFCTRRPKSYPPGPRRLPLLGNIHQVEKKGVHRHVLFSQWREKYGDIFAYDIGSTRYVVLNNYQHIKEAFAEMKFSGRHVENPMIKARNLNGIRGIIFTDSETWVEQRRFTLKTLRDFGFGKKSMEAVVMEEVEELIENFRKEAGKPISTKGRFNISVLNALWQLLAGERIPHDDPRLTSLINTLMTLFVTKSWLSILFELFPSLFTVRKALPVLFPTKGKQFQKSIMTMFKELVQQHKETLQEGSPRDFIDVYLAHIKETTNTKSSFAGQEGEMQLLVVLLDLFVAGAETTSSTLTWTFLLLASYPEKQDKMYQEIKKVTGLSRNVSLSDRPELPYVEAVIAEVLRFSSLASMGISHRLTEDTIFHGFHLPKDTLIVPNHYNAHHDPGAWDSPHEFQPERFLTADNKCVVKNDAFMPFSTGRRVCLGESLARDELFLFTGNLLQRLKVSNVPNKPKPSLETYITPSLLIPKPCEIMVFDRLA